MAKSDALRLVPTLLCAGLLLSACNSPQQREASYIKRGNKLFDHGEYEKARVEYKNAARIRPTDAEAIYRLALVNEAEGDLRGAFAGFAQAEQQDAHFRPALFKLSEYYMAAEEYDEAQTRIDTALADAPDNADAHALRAALLLHRKDYAGSEKEARDALAKDPGDEIAFSVLAGIYTQQNDDAKALAAVEDGIARNPKSLPLLLLRADIYERSNNLDKIAEAYEAIFKIAPKDIRYRAKLAAIYLKAGNIDKAEAALRAGIAALPDDWDMKRQLVAFLNDHRGMDAAEKEIRGYMQAYPDRSDLYSWLVDLYLSHDAIDRATALLNDVAAKNGLNRQGLNARVGLARIDYIKGDRDAASELVKTVLANDSNNLDVLLVRAHIEADTGFYQDSVTDLRTILRARPQAREALHLLSETLFAQGHPDLAIDTLNQLVELDPLDFSARVRLAQMYNFNGDPRHAMDMLFAVTKADPKYAPGWETTARVALDMKDWPTAETAIKTLDTLDGQNLAAAFLRGELLAKTGKTTDAIVQFKSVIGADPSSALAGRALAALVVAYRDLGKPADAMSYIESLKTSSPAVSVIQGQGYLASGDAVKAAADFDLAISANTTDQTPYLDRAKMFLDEGKTDQALDTLKKGATAAPSDLRAPLMEAQILGDAGHYQQAIDLYDDLLARDPGFSAVANNLAEIVADYEYTDPAALEKARRVAERFAGSSNPLFLDTLAWVYYRQDNIEEAQAVMQRALSLGGTLPPQVHYHFGAILLKAGKAEEAKTELQKATVNGARYPGLDDTRKLLSGL